MGTSPHALSFCYDFIQGALCQNALCEKCIRFKVFIESNLEDTYQRYNREDKKLMLFENLLHLTIEGEPDSPQICFKGSYDLKAKGKGKRVMVIELGHGVTSEILSHLIHEIPGGQ